QESKARAKTSAVRTFCGVGPTTASSSRLSDLLMPFLSSIDCPIAGLLGTEFIGSLVAVAGQAHLDPRFGEGPAGLRPAMFAVLGRPRTSRTVLSLGRRSITSPSSAVPCRPGRQVRRDFPLRFRPRER